MCLETRHKLQCGCRKPADTTWSGPCTFAKKNQLEPSTCDDRETQIKRLDKWCNTENCCYEVALQRDGWSCCKCFKERSRERRCEGYVKTGSGFFDVKRCDHRICIECKIRPALVPSGRRKKK
jgi:hypothetical protein